MCGQTLLFIVIANCAILTFVDVSVSVRDLHQRKKLVLVLPVRGRTKT